MRWLFVALALVAALSACRQPQRSTWNIPATPAPLWGVATWAPAPITSPKAVSLPSAAPAAVPAASASSGAPTVRCSPNIAAICEDPPPIGNQNGVCAAGNGNGNQVVGQPCAATPTPPPAPTPPPLTHTMDWFGFSGVPGNFATTLATVQQFDDWCVGGSTNSASVAITSCPSSFMYGSLTMGEPYPDGHDVDWPFGTVTADADRTIGSATTNCPTAATLGSFWKNQTSFNGATIPDYTSTGSNNWQNFTPGGSVGNVQNFGAGWTGTFYRFYLNLNSASLASYTQAVVQNCKFGSVVTDSMTGTFEDNAFYGKQSDFGSIWHDYPSGKNWGTNSTSPYADPTFGASGSAFVAGNFFDGSSHTRTTLVTSTDTPTATYTTDTAWGDAETAFWNCCSHRNGSPWYFITNGGNNTYNNFWLQSHHLASMMEEYDTGCFGACPANTATIGPTSAMQRTALGWPISARNIINLLAQQYNDALRGGLNTNEHIVTLADQSPLEGSQYCVGCASWEQDIRWHYMMPWVELSDDFPDQWVSMVNYCNENTCVNKFGLSFVMPNGRYQPMASSPTPYPCGAYGTTSYNFTGNTCSSGGAFDSAIGCAGATSGEWCVEFAHLFVEQVTGIAPCTKFSRANWPTCVHDIGPALLIVNATSSTTMTVNASNLSAWAPHIYSAISSGHILAACQENASMYGWVSGATTYVYRYDSGSTGTTVCTGTTGADFNAGGAPATGDAVYHDEPLSSILGDSLAPGEAMVIVP